MDRLSKDELIAQIKVAIQNYKKNVIEQKYQNNLQEFKDLVNALRQKLIAFFHRNDVVIEEKREIQESLQEPMEYLQMITGETNRLLPAVGESEELKNQNRYIRNLTLRDEVLERITLYEQEGKNPVQPGAYMVSCSSVTGVSKNILQEHADIYQKLVRMCMELDQMIYKDQRLMQNASNEQTDLVPVHDLGEISSYLMDPSLRIYTDEQIVTSIEEILKSFQSYQQIPGMKEQYHFQFNGQDYVVNIPIGKRAEFENALRKLAGLQETMQERKVFTSPRQLVDFQQEEQEFVEIQIDYELLKDMTIQQKVSYLESIMLRVEGIHLGQSIKVLDLRGNEKEISAYYYNIYMDSLELAKRYSFSIDAKYIDSLSAEDQILYYQRFLERIESQLDQPTIVVGGKKIPVRYYRVYMEAQKALQSIHVLDKIEQHSMTAEEQALVGYTIDEDYVQSLDDAMKLSYYANLIGKACQCNLEPKVMYETFGQKIEISTALVNTVQECERRVREYMDLLDLQINEMEVRGKSAEMQFTYYGKLIERMRANKKGPKTKVEAFGESFEIPYECVDTFQECIRRMEELKKSFQVPIEEPKKHTVQAVRKPFTTKVKDFVKSIPGKVKCAAFTAATIGLGLLGAMGLNSKDYQAQPVVEVSTVEETPVIPTIEIHTEEAVPQEENEKIDEWVNNAKESIASQLGSTFTLASGGYAYASEEVTQLVKLHEGFDQCPYTITKVVLQMNDQSILRVTYGEENAQEKINEALRNGAKLKAVAAVASIAEDHYKAHHVETAYFTVDQMDHVSYASDGLTPLAQEILSSLNQGRGMN